MENYINSQNQFQPSMGNAGRIFNYNGNNVTMRMQNGTVYVNLTEFAKPFPDKNLSTIINSKEINEYCESLSKLKNFSLTDLLIVTRGGSTPGTWAHQKVALRVAQKLSSNFAVWVDTKIEELLTTGKTELSNQPLSRKDLALMVLQAEEEKERLALEVQKKEEEKQAIIEETKPAVVFTECVKNASTNILVRDLAKLITQNGYTIGEYRLYDWLVENKYLIRHKRWSKSRNKHVCDYTPTQRAAEMYLFFVAESTITQSGNLAFIKHTCYITGKGQIYFLNKFKGLTKGS